MSEEYEEILVYMDFNSKVEDDLFSTDKEFKIIGIDSDEPVLQLGNQVFQGEWKNTLGTHVMFEEGDCIRSDPLFSEPPEKQMYYASKTDKILHMSRIFVNSKKNGNDIPRDTESNVDMM